MLDKQKLLDMLKEMDAEICKECNDVAYKAGYRQALLNIKMSMLSLEANIGSILDTAKENKFIMTQYVGDGSGTLDNGEQVKYKLLMAMNCSPIVECGSKYFQLSWKDILNLAEQRGLFKKEDK